ncbi:MAG: hypothetical protein H0X63_10040 [Flavobacteriales bacterium]|jgi:hypothetical protein|nr:hypothetical protein [Flavobacteriales bacterium]
MKHTLWKWKFLTFLLLILFSCQKDDAAKPDKDAHNHFGEQQIKKVTSRDIPKVMDFLNRKNEGQLRFKIKPSTIEGLPVKSSELDLIFTDLETDKILALTDEAGRTNYTFRLILESAPHYEGEESFFNLIVKEINTEEGYYAYIQEYRIDQNWYTSSLYLNMASYTGKMIFYSLEGLYMARVTFTGGEIVDDHLRTPCPDPDDPVNGDPGGSGGYGGDGTGGLIFTDIPCPCEGHLVGQGCTCAIPPLLIISEKFYSEDGKINESLRTVCGSAPDPCFLPNGDPCCTTEGCEDENDGTIINIPTKPCEKLNMISQNQDFMDKINELNTASNNTTPGTRREKGYIMEGPVTFPNYTYVESQPDDPNMNFNISTGSVISGYIHNHFFINETNANGEKMQSINVPSDADLVALYIIAKNNLIQQQFLGFPFIVVYQGNMYHLEITDVAAFIALGDLGFLNEDGRMSDFLKDEFVENNIKHENSSTSNMNNLAKLLHNGNVGLDLYQSPVNNPNWRKVKVNANNTVSLENCN